MKNVRLLILTGVLALGAFAQTSFADGNKNYPPFATIAGDKKMLDRDEINKLDEKKYPALKDLKTHFTDADVDGNGGIDKYEYDKYMTTPHD